MGDLPSPFRGNVRTPHLIGWLLVISLIIPLGNIPLRKQTTTYPPDYDRPHLMPPNPRLWEEIVKGELELPEPTPQESGKPIRIASSKSTLDQAQAVQASLSGQVNVLAVLVDFSDPGRAGQVDPNAFDELIFEAPKAGRGSVRDYFSEVSYGQVDLYTINLPSALGWIEAPGSYSSYVYHPLDEYGYCYELSYPNNCRKLAEDIVDYLETNTTIDFSKYDNDDDGIVDTLMIIHSGKGAEFTGDYKDIWSHSWSLYEYRNYDGVTILDYVIMPEYFIDPTPGDMTIGVFAHELGHSLWGLPDLYDTDYSSAGVGKWSLMAGGSWNGPNTLCEYYDGHYYCSPDGSSPAWPDAWSRMRMGWFTPEVITSNVYWQIISPAHLGTRETPGVYAVYNDRLGYWEYFLMENRQKTAGTYDEYLPGKGLLVWRVDEAMWNNKDECTQTPRWKCPDSQHYLVALEQADGDLHLEHYYNSGDAGDPFGTSTMQIQTFNGTTQPDTSSWYGTGESGITIDQITLNELSPKNITVDIQVDGVGTELPPVLYLPAIQNDYIPTFTIEEGFEGGIIPPTGWQKKSTDPLGFYNWRITDTEEVGLSHSGQFAAVCDPHNTDPFYRQDEILLTPVFTASSGELQFYSFGIPERCGNLPELYLNFCDLNVWLVYNGWGGGNDKLVYNVDKDWMSSWNWVLSHVILSPHLTPHNPVQIGFQYFNYGPGSQVGLDDVILTYIP